MPVSLFFSNRLEILSKKLSENICAAAVDLERPFEGPLVITPNANLAKWLKMALAQMQSVCMNVDFQYLEAGLWKMLTRVDNRPNPPRMLDSRLMRLMLLHLLKTLPQNQAPFTPFSDYLAGPNGPRDGVQDLKLWQMTEKLSKLFMEYGYHRPQMLEKWESGQDSADKMGRCQQHLYLKLQRLLKCLEQEPDVGPVRDIREYADTVFSRISPPLKSPRKIALHLFGISHIPPLHMSVIERLKPICNLFIYALNPCREYWEDVQTPGEKKWVVRKTGQSEPENGETPRPVDNFLEIDGGLLSLWGKPGRENIKWLCHLANYDFQTCFVSKENPQTLLCHLQNHILTFSEGGASSIGYQQDRSLQIAACPSIYREVETVYNNILYNLEHHETLNMTDMALLVPDMAKYRPVIDAVFHRCPQRIRYNLVDARADQESLYGQGVMKLLDLAESRFSRKDVFDLLLNPCVMEKWKITPPTLRVWAKWAEALNIFHGHDADAKQQSGYMPTSRHTWQQGLGRLRLSRIMAPPGTGPEAEFSHFHDLIPYTDVHTGDPESIGRFSVIIETLYRRIRDLKALEASGAEWKKRLIDLFDTFLAIPGDQRGEETIRHTLTVSLEDLDRYDQIRGGEPETHPAPRLNFFLVREFVRASLAAVTGGRGDYLTEGITISALLPMRPIPFQVVYVLGMEEGVFPGREDASSLDLRNEKPQPTDVNTPERNRYLFLEMLTSVRKKLYITYVCRDLLKDRLLKPCSVLNQLMDYLNRHLLPPETPFQTARVPLKNTSAVYLSKTAVSRTSDVRVNYALADRIGALRETGLWDKIQKGLPDNVKPRVEKLFPDFKQELPQDAEHDPSIEKITLRQLRYFLEDPVRHSLKRHMGIYDEEPMLAEITLSEDEPFFTVFPGDYQLKMAILNQWMAQYFSPEVPLLDSPNPHSIEPLFNALYDQRQRAGQAPEGAFAGLDRKRLLEEVLTEVQTLAMALKPTTTAVNRYHAVALGEHSEDRLFTDGPVFEAVFPSFPMEAPVSAGASGPVTMKKVEVAGRVNWVFQDTEKHWHTLVLTGSAKTPRKNAPIPDKYVLEPLLFWFFLFSTADGQKFMESDTVTIHGVYREKTATWTYVLSQAETEAYLSRLIARYLDPQKPMWLPFEPIVSKKLYPPAQTETSEKGPGTHFQRALQRLYEEEAHPLIQLCNPRLSAEAFSEADIRFSPFFHFVASHGAPA